MKNGVNKAYIDNFMLLNTLYIILINDFSKNRILFQDTFTQEFTIYILDLKLHPYIIAETQNRSFTY